MWSELSKIALLGTGHSALSEASTEMLRGQGIDVDKEESLVLLEAAALYSQFRKAGFKLEDFKGDLPEEVEAGEDDSCSPKSGHHLQLILDGRFSAVLPEFIYHLLENSKCLPVAQLPGLLGRGDIGNWWHLVGPALGTRGRWLLKQHPAWRKLLEDPGGNDWQTGSREERLSLLNFLRKSDPDRSRALLNSTWEEENYRDKAAFLGVLDNGLSIDDEPILEKALADRRKEVRSTAFPLLAKIPGSGLGERMFERAKACLHYENGKLTVNVPEEPDPQAVQDGIRKIHPDWKGGAKAGYLGQVVSLVSPVRWELWFDKKAGEILKMFERTNWAGTMLRAVGEAALFFDDEKWMDALLAYWFENENSPLWNSQMGTELLERAPATTVNRLSIEYLGTRPGLPASDTPVFQLLLRNDAVWDDELTMLIAGRLQQWLLSTKRQDWQSFHYKDFLEMIAYRCNPELLGTLQKGWNTGVPLWAYWEKHVEEMLNTVLFRQKMINELNG